MAKIQIDAVRMTREIREAHAEELKHVTADERIRFYREKARRVHAEVHQRIDQATSDSKQA